MTDAERLDQLLADQERAIRLAFKDFVTTMGSGPVMDEVMARLQNRDIEGALAIVDSYVIRLADILPVISQIVGTAAAAELANILPGNVMAISFDPTLPRAAEMLRTSRLELVQNFTAQQRRATQQALNRAYLEGLGTAETARAFRNSIGLTSEQENWVATYREQLRNRDRRALLRANRDRRFDPTVESSIARNRPLTERQIDAMADRYRARTLAMRAETIARTEGVHATSLAREEAVDQMIDTTGIVATRVIGTWHPTQDARVRDFHASMLNQKRPRGTPFVDGHGNRLLYPGDRNAPSETTINCRCGVTYSIAPNA